VKKTSNEKLFLRMLVSAALAASAGAHADTAPVAADSAKGNDSLLDEIVVTASGGDKSVLNTSVSVTSVPAELVKNFQPTSEAEVFRMIPGIQVNGTSGPGGNSNIAVRGLPVATGGSPFVQIQEDGLPTVLFGDMQFGNNDYWTHYDASVDRIEAVRGGSSSTFASQAPGAVINYISNTGKESGGYVQFNRGLGFDENRVDFRYGGSAGDTVHYHVGGYAHTGRGPLHAGYNVSDSVQLKGNITKDLADGKGYIRFLVKLADTKEPNYTGSPAYVHASSNSVDGISAFPGFDGRSQSNYSALNQHFNIVNSNGALQSVNTDGITTKATALQNQVHYEFDGGIKVDNNMRWTRMSGAFSAPFLNVATTASATPEGGAIYYANGLNAGQLYTNRYLNNNTDVHTNINDVGSFANDLALSDKFNLDGAGTLTARGGVFYMNQHIALDWHTNQTYSELSGHNGAMLNVVDAAGNLLTANGIAGFNNNWGACCARAYDLSYTDTAPYLNLDWSAGKWDVDASARFENMKASGWTQAGGAAFTTPISAVNPVSGNTETVNIPTLLPNGPQEYLDYTRTYTNYSIGVLYKLSDDISLFARSSRGGRFNSDRQTVGGKIRADGALCTSADATNHVGGCSADGVTPSVDFVNQYELGIKARGHLGAGRYTAELTLLKGDFKQSTYELSATRCPGGAGGCVKDNSFKSSGFEFFGTYEVGAFSLVANATYAKAEQQPSGATGYFQAQYMPKMIYTVSGEYNVLESVSIGLAATGNTSYTDGSNANWPGSEVFTGFVRYRPVKNLELGLQGYNLFDKFDARASGGVSDASVTPAVASVGAALGRTVMGTIKLSF
jgi:outer membrane receptor protein involved in Fe transport